MKACQLKKYCPDDKAKVSVAESEAEVMAEDEVEVEVEAELFYYFFAIHFSDSQTSLAPRVHKITNINKTMNKVECGYEKPKTCSAVTGGFPARHGEQLQERASMKRSIAQILV